MRILWMPVLLALMGGAAFAHGGRPYYADSPAACHEDYPPPYAREAWRHHHWEHRHPRWDSGYDAREEPVYLPAPPVYLPAPPVHLPPPPPPVRIQLWFGF